MKRSLVAVLVAAAVVLPASAARANHVPTDAEPSLGIPADSPVLKQGDVRFISNVQAAHAVAGPLGEGPPFSRDGRKYLVTSSTHYGLHIVDTTDPLRPTLVSTYASTFGCPQGDAQYVAANAATSANPSNVDPSDAQGSARRILNPLFGVGFNALLGATGWENDLSVTPDGRFAVIGMDAPGRCHDPLGGGVELVDLTDLKHPKTLHLVRLVGDSHSITIDPYNPGFAWNSTSDGNDFIDVIDFRSCLGGVAEIDACRPHVARVVFDPKYMAGLPADDKGADLVRDGCHDIRFLPDRVYCAAINTTLILDSSKVLDADGTLSGTDLTAGGACPLVDAQQATGVTVTNCQPWTEAEFGARGAEPAGVRALSVIVHDGTKPPDQDIDISHQAEPIEGGKILLITDERGGGLNFPQLPGQTSACPGGGFWLYDIRDEANPKLMRQPDGKPAVFISKNTIQSPFSCTVHYGQQFGAERILTFGWYTGGTHVVRYDVDFATGTVSFDEIATYIPAGAWTIQAKGIVRNPDNPDEIIVYTGDENRGLDVLGVIAPRSSSTTSGSTGKKVGVEVLGEHLSRTLPATGLDDPGGLGMALLSLSVLLGRRGRGLFLR